MMNPFATGTFLLACAAGLSLTATGFGLWAQWRRDARAGEVARRAVIAVAVLLSLCSATLIAAFLLDRFDLMYVAYNSNRTMPTFYKIAAFWGSLDGSMLLWAWMVAVFGGLAMVRHRDSDPDLLPVVASVFGVVLAFFTVTILSTTNPFSLLTDEAGIPFVPPDGLGMNPLLQNPSMVAHPPSLYLGFTGFTVPFAFAIAALVTGRLGSAWIRTTRRWTLIAWGFLTLGNILGSNWAYVELGWGGYWGWDPVENSSLMPWFAGTAFLHSVMVQEKKNMLRIWNVSLILLTFWLTMFGTFLTRSGIVSSVHAFANGTVGPIFLAFLIFSAVVSLGLLLWRWDALANNNQRAHPLSREGAFLFNNLVLVGLLAATFWGTVFPILNELFVGQKITIGAPYFNRVNAPLGIALLALLAIGPILAWGGTKPQRLLKQLRLPAAISIVAVALAVALGAREPYALAVYVFVAMAIGGIVDELQRGTRARMRAHGEALHTALLTLVRRNPRRYGGYIVHVGVVLLFIGITGNLFARETQVNLVPGQAIEFADYRIELESIEHRNQPNFSSQMAIFSVQTPRGETLQMWPEKRQYRDGRGETSTEVAIDSRLFADLYLIFVNEIPETGAGVFRFHLNPLVQWIWLGGAVMLVGMLVAVGGRRKESA